MRAPSLWLVSLNSSLVLCGSGGEGAVTPSSIFMALSPSRKFIVPAEHCLRARPFALESQDEHDRVRSPTSMDGWPLWARLCARPDIPPESNSVQTVQKSVGLLSWIDLGGGLHVRPVLKSTLSCDRSPWYNRNGWLGVKHQVTYLLETEFDCPEVNLCGLQDVTNPTPNWLQRRLGRKRGSFMTPKAKSTRSCTSTAVWLET